MHLQAYTDFRFIVRANEGTALTIDGCDRSFDELANKVLPGYMEALRTSMVNPLPLAALTRPGVGLATALRQLELEHDFRGCYVLIDSGRAVYVGISKHVIERLIEHVRGGDHYSATLAYRIAKHERVLPPKTTAATAMQDAEFKAHFLATQKRIIGWHAAFVEIENPLELYLFEPYCAVKLDTGFEAGGWNTFETH